MTSQKVLAHALAKYEGSVVIVSHDRHFLRTVTTDVLALWPHHTQVPARPPDGWRLYSGTYGEFEGSRLGEVFFSEQPQTVSPPGATTGSKISYAREKERRSEARKLQRHEETLLQRMEELESEHREIQERMAAYETYTDADAMRALRSRLEKNETDQAQTAEEWERVSERLQHYDYSL
jgi:ATPase subunit of ABC transporter with duplicated ATPase domains